MRYITIIGLEVHVQLKTASKMFCSCKNVGDDAPPNTAICPVCTGQPGALPALNAKAIELGMTAGLALNCTIPDQSVFDRKNYFYPDLSKGYQISQFHLPIAINGRIDFDVPNGMPQREHVVIGITRAHLEEDAAKNFHAASTGDDGHATYVDYNRSSTPLLEIVSEPDIRSAQEAKAYLQELRSILRAVGASDAEMENGQMRCDANVSLLPIGDDNLPLIQGLNPKVEIKNLNSFRAVERAITYEIQRQGEMYEANEVPMGATRGWDEDRGVTFEQRTKETSADYRYFPEPDLPPQDLRAMREHLSTRLPELPAEKRARLMEEFLFSPSDAAFLVANEGWSDYADHVMGELSEWIGGESTEEKKKKYAKLAGGWLTTKLAGLLTEKNLTITTQKIDPENFAEFLHLLEAGEINSSNAQKLLALMLEKGTDPSHIMEEHNLGQNMPDAELLEIAQRLVSQNPDQVAQVKAGKAGVLKWFVGGIMKATEGRANPAKAEDMVKTEIDKL